jgi:predicted dehydrogenase
MNVRGEPIQVAIVGCGGIARAHAASLKKIQGTGGTVFVSRDPAKAERTASECGGRFARSYEAVLQDPDIRAVVLCTPHDCHAPETLQAAKASKHVLVEKPIARTLEEAAAMRDAAVSAGVRCMVAENFHFIPVLLKAREILLSGRIGGLHTVIANGLYQAAPTGWRTEKERMGGGALIDGGIHYVDGLRLFGGEINSVRTVSPAKRTIEMEGEEAAYLDVRFANGVAGMLNFSWTCHGLLDLPDFLILGSHGSITVRIRSHYMEIRDPRKQRVFTGFMRFHSIEKWGFFGVMRAFLDLIQDDSALNPMDAREGMRDLAVVLAAYRSIETGETGESVRGI